MRRRRHVPMPCIFIFHMVQSLATIGPEKTTARITSVPGFIGDDHKTKD